MQLSELSLNKRFNWSNLGDIEIPDADINSIVW